MYEHIQEVNAANILDSTERIFNLDETGVLLCPKTGVILAPKNYRAMYTVASGQEKQCITVLCNFSASGEIVTPFIVYPLQRISKEVAQSVPDEWGIGRSESGWMKGDTFLQYIKEIFLPWLQKNNIIFPVLLLVDGHKSHINLELHEFCVQNKIILFCLYPNTTHILQPCDVGIFGPLKAAWKTIVRKYKNKENTQITRSNFAKIFAQAFEISMKKNVIVNAFKVCGISPFNPSAVDYSKCISNRQKEIEHDISLDDYKTTIKVIEKVLQNNVLAKYKEYRRLKKTFKSSLFKFWNKCHNKVDNLLLSQSSIIDDSTMQTDNSNTGVKVSTVEVTSKTQDQRLEEQNIEAELSIITETSFGTPATNTFIQGMMDIENMPIEIEGVSLLLNDLDLENTHQEYMSPTKIASPTVSQSPATVFDMTNTIDLPVHWNVPQITSTPVSSNQEAIPLPWYTEDNGIIQNVSLQVNVPYEQNISQNIDVTQNLLLQVDLPNHRKGVQSPDVTFEKDPCIQEITLENNEPSCSKVTDKIDELLKLPENKKGIKRKRVQSPMPLAITSKKFKEYLTLKENEKKKKAEDIMKRKIQREQKRAEKEKNIKEKKSKLKKTNTELMTKVKVCEEEIPAQKTETTSIVKKKTVTSTTSLIVSTGETKMNKENKERLNNDKIKINFGDYVVLKFETNKRNRYYVGQVLKIDFEDNFVKVKCLRKKASKFDNLTYFNEPSTADLTEVSTSAILNVLPSPQIGRRGLITFKNTKFDLTLCE